MPIYFKPVDPSNQPCKVIIYISNIRYVAYYIMAGRAFVAAKEVFIMETIVFWHCDNS